MSKTKVLTPVDVGRRVVSQQYYYDKGVLTGPIGAPEVSLQVFGSMPCSITYGDNIPGYRDLIRRGHCATTSLNVDVTRKESWPASSRILHTGKVACRPNSPYTGGAFLTAVGYSDPSPVSKPSQSLASEESKARSFLFKKVRAAHTEWESGVFLGELRETLRMIRNPANSLVTKLTRYVRASKRGPSRKSGRRRTVKQRNDYVAGLYLEYSFGWTPLYNDVLAGSEALANFLHKSQKDHLFVTARSSITPQPLAGTSNHSARELFGRHYVETTSTLQTVGMVTYRGVVRLKPRAKFLMAGQFFGWDFRSFAPTVWNLLPFSFLVDYFVNVNEVISGWSTQVSSLEWVARTDFWRSTASKNIIRYSPTDVAANIRACNWVGVQFQPGHSKVERTVINRYVIPVDTLRYPDLQFRIPGFRQGVNISALLKAGAFRRR